MSPYKPIKLTPTQSALETAWLKKHMFEGKYMHHPESEYEIAPHSEIMQRVNALQPFYNRRAARERSVADGNGESAATR